MRQRGSLVPRRRAHPIAQRRTDSPPPAGPEADRPAGVDLPRIEHAIREIIVALGEDPDREGLRQTPARIARAYAELTRGLRIDPRTFLETVFHEKYNQIVLLRNIPFHSMCEHHFLPFVGHAHVAYLPRHRVVGLSNLATRNEVLNLIYGSAVL